ncbi:MAG: hypothetical protein M3365_03535, partial [Gemmatimonadota bacterium]|nr:hypothetical protein [Gemmatimonadota bacterium]
TVKSGEEWLNRIELRLKSGDETVEVHLYEGYWAPLTEGRTTARNVIGFLTGAGLNGLRNTRGRFRRWLFGKYPVLPIPVRTVFSLLTALATVLALVAMNSAVAIVVAALTLLDPRPSWLSENLFADLTTTFNLVVTVMGLFGLTLAAAVLTRRLQWRRNIRTGMSFVTLFTFALAVLVVVLAGAAIPFTFYGHVRDLTGESRIWYLLADTTVVDGFNDLFDRTALRIALVVAVIVLVRWSWRIIKGLRRDFGEENRLISAGATAAFLVLFGAVVALVAFFARTFSANAPEGSPVAEHIAWPLLVVASIYIRLILVQFVGDVAIYVMPYKLDAFNDLRREIKQRVYKAAKAVYSAQPRYDRVIVVGHSLGSVVAYDALNMLILEDESPVKTGGADGDSSESENEFLDIVNRTPLFVTFGSALDKTAFVFSVQARGTSEAREALAGSVQPLIQDYARRPKRWINIWSPWDIISGPLDLYDLPLEPGDPTGEIPGQRVHNVRDREATTLLMAHTEYWKNPVLVGAIYGAMEALNPSTPRR